MAPRETELLAVVEDLKDQLAKALVCIDRLERENADLRARVSDLEEKLRTNSSNSSMPPSSDPPSVPKRKRKEKGKRKQGGQPGHEGKARELLPPEQVDEFVSCPPNDKCSCGGTICVDGEHPERHQVLELPEVKPLVLEYLIYSGACRECGRVHRGELPNGVPSGMLGPRAMAAVAVLSGKYHLSKRGIEELLSDLMGLDVSLGTISATEGRVSEALAKPMEEVKSFVRQQAVVHADETSHKVAGKRAWMWVAVTSLVSVFIIRFSRGQQVVKELLGEAFGGVLVSDRWNAYNRVDTSQRQLCWAHLKRDFTKISELGGRCGDVGDKLLEYVQEMFHLWHSFRNGKLSRPELQLKMTPIRREVVSLLEECVSLGYRKAKTILKLKSALWTFVDVPGVEPTNNLAERTIRPYVLWRKSSFGTQSERGNLFVERMMTASATCKQQQRNVLDYVTAAVRAYLRGEAVPSLLPRKVLPAAA